MILNKFIDCINDWLSVITRNLMDYIMNDPYHS